MSVATVDSVPLAVFLGAREKSFDNNGVGLSGP